ncbi:hypothetical protein CEP48_05790 [Mergibacter septicus]|uniref:Murein endopeptidase K n=1 Tax=Mergibacter septicus TaxID=221402 RepID=A0A8D4LMF1_9PAST|nr:DUF882 domain-containing protein [Mergibacter septicus]AWX15712.1 hypothetical protein CEP47_05790 [Mergibacter septicus]QDJ14965.1 hypothetical protein CEP48_05790 [Mergibacter septicus]UTU47610.1 DUF882 domain-containing protein [Mergibacter septicus]WMR96784.1 DUF882 domain-containing protein [Mergibacter septicus]
MEKINQTKRKWLSLGGLILGGSLFPHSTFATVLNMPQSRLLKLKNINTGEKLISKYINGKSFSAEDMKKINYLMRDRRTNLVHTMDPKLFAKFYDIQNKLGLRNCELSIICGYRSPKTNAQLHSKSNQVAVNSYHIKGQAIDFRIDCISLAKVRDAAKSLKNGGVGYYPKSNFIHIDTGPVRNWRGT